MGDDIAIKTKGVFIRVPYELLQRVEARAKAESKTRQNWILKVLKEKVR